MKIKFMTNLALLLVFCGSALAQEKLAVLPFICNGVDAPTQKTVRQLLNSEISRLKKYELVPEVVLDSLPSTNTCIDAACALEIGRQSDASRVVFGSLNRLGEKIIVKYDMVDVVTGTTVLSDDISALRVEDLDVVCKRVAASIAAGVPVDKTLVVGQVTEQESLEENTRKANSSWGVGFGYLYPQKGYDEKDNIFIWDFRSVYEMQHLAVDAILGLRQGVALNIGFLYIPGRKDFTPFVGGGVGFHAVSHDYRIYYSEYDDSYYTESQSSDGFEIIVKGGLMAFRTYDFRVVATLEYCWTFNDDNDRAIGLTFGIMRAGKKVFGIF